VPLYKTIAQSLLFIWLAVLACQSLNIIKFGVITIPKSWIFYISLAAIGVTLLDHFNFLDKKLTAYVFIALLIYLVVYTLVYAFDIYRFSSLVNRSEHFFGSILSSFIVYSFLSKSALYTQIPSQTTKLILLFCVVSALGVFNEIIEMFFDLMFKTKNIGPGIFDTNLDLLMNTLGTGAFIFFSRYLGLI